MFDFPHSLAIAFFSYLLAGLYFWEREKHDWSGKKLTPLEKNHDILISVTAVILVVASSFNLFIVIIKEVIYNE